MNFGQVALACPWDKLFKSVSRGKKLIKEANKIDMGRFKKYRRTQVAEMRDVTRGDIEDFKRDGCIFVNPQEAYEHHEIVPPLRVSISDADLKSGSPKIGDKIARNPVNFKDQWLVAKDYFEANFETL